MPLLSSLTLTGTQSRLCNLFDVTRALVSPPQNFIHMACLNDPASCWMCLPSHQTQDVEILLCDWFLQQPMRAKHCEDCGRCVRKFDHHCPWLDTCVGEQNHKFFLVFLVTETALILWAVYIVG